MKVNIIGRQMNVWDEMKIIIENKLKKLDKYFSDECSATATLSCRRDQKCLEITIVAAGTIFRSEVEDETFRNALDRAVYLIERQIRKNKTASNISCAASIRSFFCFSEICMVSK